MTTVKYHNNETILNEIRREGYVHANLQANAFHATSVKFIQLISDLIVAQVEPAYLAYIRVRILNRDPRYDVFGEIRNFPLDLIKAIEEAWHEFDGFNTTAEPGLYRNAIFNGLMNFIERKKDRNITLITPWDIIGILTNERGESIIPFVAFPSNTIQTEIMANNVNRKETYDLGLEQFLGMVAGADAIRNGVAEYTPVRTDSIFDVTIFGVTTKIDSFNDRLRNYYYELPEQLRQYHLVVPSYNQPRSYTFDNLEFVSGLVTIMNQAGKDYHRYRIELRQGNNLVQF